jgi:hypothetical protein
MTVHLSHDSASDGLLWAQFAEKLSDYQFPSRNILHGLTEIQRVLESKYISELLDDEKQ